MSSPANCSALLAHAGAAAPGPLRWHSRMRLSPSQIQAIVAATAELAGSDAQVRLFGSRLDDTLHGGDIDLLVECPNKVARPALA